MNTHDHNHDHDHDHDHNHEPKESVRDSRYWLSLEQYNQDPEFAKIAEKEFMSSPLQEEEGKDGFARRDFIKLMGASIALASTGCIRRPVQKIVPYNKQPEEVTYTVSNFYTSTYFDGADAQGLLIKTREGRPLKIEGNPKHPANQGSTTVRSQAHILSLYDPERLKGPHKNLLNKAKTNRDTISQKWEDVDAAVVKQLNKGSVVLLTGSVNSPSLRALISDFGQAFGSKHVAWEPLAHDDVSEGQRVSYGSATVPNYRFDKAKMIVSVDADFLGTWMQPANFTRQFSQGRKDIKNMNRLVVFDSAYSLTGANGDIRVRIKPSQQVDVVMGLAYQIATQNKLSKPVSVEAFANTPQKIGMDPALFKKIAEDLWANRGKSLVVAGGLATRTAQGVQLQVAVNYLNSLLGNDGETVEASGIPGLTSSYEAMNDLIESLEKGQVKTVIIHGVNPVYALPTNAKFVEALRKAEMVIYTGDRNDETGRCADFLCPDHHRLEGWGDNEIARGLYSVQQPTIRPMYDTRSFALSLMTWAYLAEKGPKRIRDFETTYDYVRNIWKEEIAPKASKGKSFEDFWDEALQEGVVGTAASGGGSRSFNTNALSQVKSVKSEGPELVLYPTVALADGSLANVAWLQELPDPVTKICWDNYFSVSLAMAEKLKLKEGDVLEVNANGVKIELPTHIQPGLHDEVIAVAVGYGRTAAGKVANGIGKNAYEFAQFNKGNIIFSGHKVEAKKTGKNITLANPQGHHSMEGRQIVVEATLEQYLKDPKAGRHHQHHVFQMWSGHQYSGHKWAMGVDLNSCTGCNACVIACQSENNIPVVGKKYVIQGREMHWIRVDRYYVGDPKNAEVVFQPLMCQHCDNAPCESVCPVAATVHSDEGLNDMVYNRCVGTRYCSNNCPYKVRRFNWFNYAKLIEKPSHLALNPDVTVRPRGVMEKCTFCVQRIKEGKQKARVEKRELKDGEIQTACQSACPSGGIVFGDMNDKDSAVSKMFADARAYALLEEFHAAPSVRYLSKIRNNGESDRGGHGDAHGKGGHS